MSDRHIMTVETRGPEETERIGARVGRAVLSSGRRPFLALYGDLGAGKTVFVRGLCSVLSPGRRVKSPTYTLVNEYRRGAVPVFHFDLSRITAADELDGIGFDDYIEAGICVAEWSEKLGGEVPSDAVTVRIEKADGDGRRITVEGLSVPEEESA